MSGFRRGTYSGKRLLVSLHDGIGDEGSGDLPPAEPTPIQTFNGALGSINSLELDVYFALKNDQLEVSSK